MLPHWRHALSLVQGSPAGTDKRQKGVADGALLHRRGEGGAPINARKASPAMTGASRPTNSTTGLVSDEAKHLNGKSQPQLIGLNLP